jgi:hypothetical protein
MTERLLTAFLVAVFALSALPVGGQTLASTPLLTDGTGDVTLVAAGTPGPDSSSVYPAADLVSLRLDEGSADITWVLEVADLRPASEDTGADGVTYDVRFEHHGRFFLLHIVHTLAFLQDGAYAYLDARDAGDGEWGQIWNSYDNIPMDFAADTYTVTLPRGTLADADGAPPFPGRNLTAISVRSVSTAGGGLIYSGGSNSPLLSPYTIVDDMPAVGEPPATYAIAVGVQQQGHAHLASPTPFRASNGEATTFVYQVEASNLGDEDETFELSVRNVPERVTVVLPVPLLPISANESIIVPVLATVPFAHNHGALESFLLELTSLDDARSIGRLEMGINYLAVPQPAGHHDTLYLHNPPATSSTPGLNSGLLPFSTGTMSTIEDEQARPAYYSDSLTFTGLGSRFEWEYDLAPALAMGLDVDLNRTGHASITVSTVAPLLQATLDGALYVRGQDGFGADGAFVAAFAPQAPIDIGSNSAHTFEVDVVGDPESDRIPLQPGSNLVLLLTLEGTTTPTGFGTDSGPAIQPGASMVLPLNEWHDDVDDALSAVDGPSLESLGPQERLVNPGEAAVFNVSVQNPTNESIPFRLAVSGSNVNWSVLPEDSFVLPPETNATFALVVRAPADALDGDRADLILQAYPRDEPSLRGLIRLLVEVDTDVDHVDEAPLANKLTKSKDSPGLAVPLLAAGLVCLALARRRKQE